MDISLRPMETVELPLVRDSWTRSMDPPGSAVPVSGRYITRVGGAKIIGWAWYEMHRAWVRKTLDESHVIVATIPGSDELVGWCCFSAAGKHNLVVHYLYTTSIARRKGIGSHLLLAALTAADDRAPRFSHMTPLGQDMVDKIRHTRARQMPREAAMR